jgi:hypothetical protein
MRGAREPLKQALQRQRRRMSLNGLLDLSGNIEFPGESLAGLGSQKALVELHLNFSPLTSLHTLPPQPCLKTIIADNSRIDSLAGLGVQPRLMIISFIGAPVSDQENFRLTALVGIGTRLSFINGVQVTKTERRQAQAFPPIAKHLVGSGWLVQYPPPSELDFRYLAEQFGIVGKDEDFVSKLGPITVFTDEKVPQKEKNRPIGFGEKIATILRPLGFGIRCGNDMNSDILKAITKICDVVEKIENQSKSH